MKNLCKTKIFFESFKYRTLFGKEVPCFLLITICSIITTLTKMFVRNSTGQYRAVLQSNSFCNDISGLSELSVVLCTVSAQGVFLFYGS